MKKCIVLVLTVIVVLGFAGCGGNTYELPHDQFCYSVDLSAVIELETEDKSYIVDLLNEASWVNDLSNCDSDFVFYTQNQEVSYHSECGTFNDITNKKSMTVSEEERVAINTALGVK